MDLHTLQLSFHDVTHVLLEETKSGKHRWIKVYLYRGEDRIHFMDIFTKDGADIKVEYKKQEAFLNDPEVEAVL